MSLASAIASKNPVLKNKLRIARIITTPEKYVQKSLINATIMTAATVFLVFLFLNKNQSSYIPLIFVLIVGFFLFYKFNMIKVDAAISKRRKDIDKDVLFAGRYLLVKLNSGQPLINALVDASKSYGVANKYFKEIVKDIELGKPVEKAIADEAEFSPSKRFRKILFQISNALKIGIDVTEFLDATLEEISNEQLIEINRYGKKLNSVTLFYMLFAVVMPSLGLTIFTVIQSLSSEGIDMTFFLTVLFFLALLQVMFLAVYKSIRPNINI